MLVLVLCYIVQRNFPQNDCMIQPFNINRYRYFILLIFKRQVVVCISFSAVLVAPEEAAVHWLCEVAWQKCRIIGAMLNLVSVALEW